ncbi:Uncharacterized protein Adt_33341 [Abeliophyllum distichum]|uniref:Uncharacterized protein n=1 Tax=Abeliophyllum distichum TaxID=126358 RepID=A0ABD1QVZ3_9LAMI
MYRIPDDIEFVVPGPDDQADDPPLGCVALNQAVLAAGLRLPFPKSNGKRLGWWYASVKAKTGGSVVTQTPDSIKNWKKFWFFVRGPWQFAENDARPDLSILVRYHELRYVAQEFTEEFSERARRARDISENLRSSAVLITEENLISARLFPSLSDRPVARDMKDISALLRKNTQSQAGKGKRKVPAGDQDRSSRPRMELELPPSLNKVRQGVWRRSPYPSPSEPSRPLLRPPDLHPPGLSSNPPTWVRPRRKMRSLYGYVGLFLSLVHDFIRSNSSTREEITGLPLSTRRAIRSVAKCWTPAHQKYLESMGVVDSVVASSVNVSRAAIQLTSASEKMGRLLSDVQVMKDEGRKVVEELEDEKRLRAASEDVLFRHEEELRGKEAELRAMAEELERANKSRADLENDLEAERKYNTELRAALEKSAGKKEAVAEFRSSDAYLAEQEMVYFLTMEELIETTVEKRPDWDVQFLRDELSDLKRKSTLNPPSLEEVDLGQPGAEE